MVPDKLKEASSFMSALTPRGVGLLLILATGLGMLYAMWSERAFFLANVAMTVAATVAIFMLIVGLVLMDMYGRLKADAEQALQARTQDLVGRAEQLQIRVDSLQAQINSLQKEHTECLKLVAKMAVQQASSKNSGFGDLQT